VRDVGITDGFRAQKLIRNLQDPDLKVRASAIDDLGELGDARVVEPLIAALTAKENTGIIKTRAIVALGKLGDRRATAPLLRVLFDRRDLTPFSETMRVKTAEALGRIGDSRAIPHLLSYLSKQGDRQVQGDDDVGMKVRDALVRIGTSDPSHLIRALKEGDSFIRAEAARALLHIGTGDAMEGMIAALDDLNYVVRLHAAAYLGKWGDQRAIEPLIRSLKDVNRDVRSSVRTALDTINARTRRLR